MTHQIPNTKSLIPLYVGTPSPKSPIPGLFGRFRIPNAQSLIPDTVRAAANAVVSALLAPACAVCGALLDEPLSGCVCAGCWRSIQPTTPPVCDRCGDPLARSDDVCGDCHGHAHVIGRARAIGEYEGTLREIIHALKYSGRISLACPLAERMRQRGMDLIDEVDCVVPVPLHWRREHQRGFNQAREIARHLGPPLADVLRRVRATRAQVELAADRRRANVIGAFSVRHQRFRGPDIRGKKLLLVDDVSTTGATLESCARVLEEFGALEVYALTAARVVARGRGRIYSPTQIPNP
jgi:ComF family protein